MKKLRLMTLATMDYIEIDKRSLPSLYNSTDDIIKQLHDFSIGIKCVHSISFYPKFEDGDVIEYTIKLLNNEYEPIAIGTFKYEDNTDSMNVDQIMDKLKQLSNSFLDKDITLTEYLTDQKIYENKLRKIANVKYKHEDIFKA